MWYKSVQGWCFSLEEIKILGDLKFRGLRPFKSFEAYRLNGKPYNRSAFASLVKKGLIVRRNRRYNCFERFEYFLSAAYSECEHEFVSVNLSFVEAYSEAMERELRQLYGMPL
jgi:hypothetical protein